MRVQVWSGDQSDFLGEGELVGEATVYFLACDDGSLISMNNPEERPPPELVAEKGGEIIESKDNPKIRLDDGSFVYGCQVWWKPLPDGKAVPEPSDN